MKNNPSLRHEIMSGKTVAGAMIFEFFTPGISAMLANAGARFAIYDMEHTGLGYETLKWLFATCRGLPITPMVRVPTGEYTWIARALDIGAQGIMVPMVESKEQAQHLAQSCRYPKTGRRGAAFGFAQCDYADGSVAEKMERYNERTLMIAQIETELGLEHVESIAAVEGIDVLWVGHFDLSNFMGIPGQFDHPDFVKAMIHVSQVAKKHGKIAGFMATDQAWITKAKNMGYTMIAGGTDTGLLTQSFKKLIDGIE